MKGFFTQGLVLLLDRKLPLGELAPLLEGFGSGRVYQVAGSGDWTRGGDSLLLPFGEHGGHLAIDLVDEPWPDELVERGDTPQLGTSAAAGYFGPFAFPYCFERACRQAWIWKEAQQAPPRHAAFARVRTTYAFRPPGAAPETAVAVPEIKNPLIELQAATAAVQALARHPAAVAYFDPSGETLLPPDRLGEAVKWAEEQQLPPLDVWTNVRFLSLEGLADGWFLMDTVGMWQLDIPDHEIFLPGKTYDFQEVEGFLRNVSLYLMNHGPVLGDGDTIEGPGGIDWKATSHDDSFTMPPRPVVRWFADDGTEPPPQLASPPKMEPT